MLTKFSSMTRRRTSNRSAMDRTALDRAAMEARSERRRTDQRYRPESRQRLNGDRFQSELDRDFAAMKRVWQMLRHGAVRMLGEVGRQY